MTGNRHSQATRDKAFELYAQGLSALAISNKIGNVSSTTVLRWLKGITPPIEEGGAIENLKGQIFTKLTVKKLGTKPVGIKSGGAWWWCECSCKKMCVLVPAMGLKQKYNKSCGCIGNKMLGDKRNYYSQETREKARQLKIHGNTARQIGQILGGIPKGTVTGWFETGTNQLKKFKGKKDRSGEVVGLLNVDCIIEWDDLPECEKSNFNEDRKRKRNGRNYSNEITEIYQCTCKSCERKSYWTWDGLCSIKRKLNKEPSAFRGCIWCDLIPGATDYLKEPYNGKVSAWQVIKWRRGVHEMPSIKSETILEWFCKCTLCNKTERWIRASQLNAILRGVSKNKTGLVGCGCNTKPLQDYYQKYGRAHMEWFYETRTRARRENIPFNLDPDDFADIPEVCPVLGIPIITREENITGKPLDNSPSIDKFYPELGYVKGNIHIISYRANRFKSDGTPAEWVQIAEWCKKEDLRKKLEGRHPDQQKNKAD